MSEQEKRYCPYCGHELPPGQVWYCPYCGSSLKGVQLTTSSTASGSEVPPRSKRKRPSGVLAVGILSILSGIVLLFLGAAMFAMRVMLTQSLLNQLNSQVLSTYGIEVTYSEIMTYSLYMGIAFLGMSVLMLVSAAGLISMKRWGLVLSIIVAGLMTLSSLLYVVVLLDLAFVFVFLLSLAILIYLVRSRAAFGRCLVRDKHNCDRLISRRLAQQEDLDELARRRGFFWPSYEIYGGVGGLYDLGPNGTSVKNRIIQLWRDHFIRSSEYPMVEIETPMVTPYEVLEASGHVESFTDPLTICPKCHRVYRADQLAESQLGVKTEGMTIEQLNELYSKETVKCEACGTRLETVQSFNLLFQTWIGPFNSERAFLRPETAQGIFTAFKRTFETARRKLPLGVAQVGRVARNEISPRQSLIRMREFTIMEFEFFFDPEDANALPKKVADTEVRIKLSSGQLYVGALGDALKKGYVANAWMAYFIHQTLGFMNALGFSTAEVLFLEKGEKERAHYSSQTFDVMVPTKGWGDIEVAGIAYRTDYDLRHHSQKSGEDLSVSVALPQPYARTVVRAKVDRAAIGKRFGERSKEVIDAINQLAASGMPQGRIVLNLSFGSVELDEGIVKFEEVSERVTTRKFYPHVVEPSFGADRLLYAVIDHSITEREGRKILSLPAALAPYDVAVFPLIDDESMKAKALSLVSMLKSSGFYVFYDDDGTIGRRYARVDEIGVPWAITVDDRSIKGEGVTIRDRDTWQQWRVADDQVLSVLGRLRSGEKLYQMDLPRER